VIITDNLGLSDISVQALSRLIEQLDEMYPDRMPDFTLSEKEFAFRAGQVSVVRTLKYKLNVLKEGD
jgi:uncharacterized protein YeeX (DUF496 family)